MRNIKIFDTTLRDGEQSPGCSMNIKEKIEVAKQLELLRVDIIEAGFAIASKGDFESIKAVADEVRNCTIASLARTLPKDIDTAWEAIKNAEDPMIHTFIATSDIHMEYKLKKTPDEVYEQAVEAVKYAKKYVKNIEFSCEDASRSNWDFLVRMIEGVIKAGATIINIPDTVGYTTPGEFAELIKYVKNNAKGIENVGLSVHCHNDLGLAVANSLEAVKAGATQVECTINGIGERAGNAALEEVVMNLYTRKDLYNATCNIDNTQIYRSSKLLTQITGVKVQPNKAIVGDNAFAHEAGIHQHGVLANRETYEIMTPEAIGLTENKMVLGKHSGRHAFVDRIETLGYHLNEEVINSLFEEFKALADKKKTVNDRDIEALVRNKTMKVEPTYTLERFVINAGNTITPTSNVVLKLQGNGALEDVASGTGPIDASFNAINKAISGNDGYQFELEEYSIDAVTEGRDAQGEVSVRIKANNNDAVAKGYGLSTDIIEASILAYIDAINNYIYENGKEVK